jgi:hypothetical protein
MTIMEIMGNSYSVYMSTLYGVNMKVTLYPLSGADYKNSKIPLSKNKIKSVLVAN